MVTIEELDRDLEERLRKEKSVQGHSGGSIIGLLATLPFLIIVGLFFTSFCIARIPAGYVGVAYSIFGGVLSEEYSEGWHIKPPWVSITLYSIRTSDYTMSLHKGEGQRYGDDRINVLTKEGLSVDLDLTVLYRIIPEKADVIHRNIGPLYEERVIRPNIRSIIREIIATHTASEVYSEMRREIAKELETTLKERLKKYNIIIQSVLLRNVILPPKLAESIENKQKAEQEVLRMEYILRKTRKEAEQRLIEAEGIKNATIIQAEGEAAAIAKIQEQLGTSDPAAVLGYYYIKTLASQKIDTVIVPTDGGVPIFLPSSIKKGEN